MMESGAQPYRFEVLTLFPNMILGAIGHSIVGRAISSGLVQVHAQDIRDQTDDRHRTVDDVPYGGGAGMVMKAEPVVRTLRIAREAIPNGRVVLMSASGRPFTQAKVREYATLPGLILVCGHYEGVDERVAEHYVDEELSIGDYVLSGGEIPALVVLDAVVRLIPGVLGNTSSLAEESHESGLLEYPQYSRPVAFEGYRVPDVLLSGNHAEIARWRRQAALEKTRRNRPDLIAKLPVSTPATNSVPPRLGRPLDPRPDDPSDRSRGS